MNHLIIDSVALLVAPAVRIEDVQAIPDWKTGEVRNRVQLRSAMDKPVVGQVRIVVAPAVSGESAAEAGCERVISAGETRLEMNLRVPHHRLWELNDPYLYRVTARVQVVGTRSADELGVRVGFRDFQFENGCFRMNGRRHNSTHAPQCACSTAGMCLHSKLYSDTLPP